MMYEGQPGNIEHCFIQVMILSQIDITWKSTKKWRKFQHLAFLHVYWLRIWKSKLCDWRCPRFGENPAQPLQRCGLVSTSIWWSCGKDATWLPSQWYQFMAIANWVARSCTVGKHGTLHWLTVLWLHENIKKSKMDATFYYAPPRHAGTNYNNAWCNKLWQCMM